jgi:hypothetical protein
MILLVEKHKSLWKPNHSCRRNLASHDTIPLSDPARPYPGVILPFTRRENAPETLPIITLTPARHPVRGKVPNHAAPWHELLAYKGS